MRSQVRRERFPVRGEWILLGIVAGAGLGVIIGTMLGAPDAGVWAGCLVGAVLIGGVVQFATRGHGPADLPPVSMTAVLVVAAPVILGWSVVGSLTGVTSQALGPASITWFVGGILVARTLARMLSAPASPLETLTTTDRR